MRLLIRLDLAVVLVLGTLGATDAIAAPTTSAASSEAAGVAVLDQAAAAYAKLDGLSMNFEILNGLGAEISVRRSGTFDWQKLGRSRIRYVDKKGVTVRVTSAVTAIPPNADIFLEAFLQGKNPLRDKNTFGGDWHWGQIGLLPDNGVSATAHLPDGTGRRRAVRYSMYLDATDHLLRRVEIKSQSERGPYLTIEAFSDVQLDPTFAADTFVVPNPPASEESAEIYWDPKLKVGTVPYALKGADLAKYRGKVVLLDFWATWCGPCVAELPNVQSNYQKYHAKGLEVIGISLDEDKAALANFVKARKLPWLQLFDGKGWKTPNALRYGVQGIPFTLLIGRDGKIAAIDASGEELEPALKKALAQ